MRKLFFLERLVSSYSRKTQTPTSKLPPPLSNHLAITLSAQTFIFDFSINFPSFEQIQTIKFKPQKTIIQLLWFEKKKSSRFLHLEFKT